MGWDRQKVEFGFGDHRQRSLRAAEDGDIENGAASRTVFSTENSIYQIEQTGILFPRSIEDLQITAAVLSEP
ncbi:hypothetical protein, partial [Rhizobium leguminosarum]|uniref:hypothetical protein n=1 Tax=Rhizobium leguminosarum TaxID=384 RepID=UPI003F9606E1